MIVNYFRSCVFVQYEEHHLGQKYVLDPATEGPSSQHAKHRYTVTVSPVKAGHIVSEKG